MAVDYTNEIPELLSPDEREEAVRQLKMDWDNAQAAASARFRELGNRRQFDNTGISYDVGNPDTERSIDQEILNPVRTKLARFFPGVRQEQQQRDIDESRAATREHLKSLEAERAAEALRRGEQQNNRFLQSWVNQSYRRNKLAQQESNQPTMEDYLNKRKLLSVQKQLATAYEAATQNPKTIGVLEQRLKNLFGGLRRFSMPAEDVPLEAPAETGEIGYIPPMQTNGNFGFRPPPVAASLPATNRIHILSIQPAK